MPERHRGAWERATRHPFVAGVRDGTLTESAFAAWLVQDYRFVGHLLRFQARLVARAPRSAQAVLAAGTVALVDELGWFERQVGALGLDLDAPELPATTAYLDLLDRLDGVEAPIAMAMLWAVERVYLDAWSYAAPGAPAFRDCVSHWTTPAFAVYVRQLQDAADRSLSEHVAGPDLDTPFAEVVAAEVAFWDMALARRESS